MNAASAYWQENIRLVAGCLLIWFLVSYGCGILFVDELNRIPLGGYKLGFWFAQQGSIYVFVALIFSVLTRISWCWPILKSPACPTGSSP